MKIFLDDIRKAPEGYTLCSSPGEVIKLLKTRKDIKEVSLDHDLGEDEPRTGFDVLVWIEEQVICNHYKPPYLKTHTTDPLAIMRMNIAIKTIERLASIHKK